MWEEPWQMRKVAEMMCGATWVSGGGVKQLGGMAITERVVV